MVDRRISELDIAPVVYSSDYVIVDNVYSTKRAQLNALSSLYTPTYTFNKLVSGVDILVDYIGTITNNITGTINTNITFTNPRYESVYSTVNPLSSNWNSVFSTVNANSSISWNYQGTDLKNLSSGWSNVYSTVNLLSSNWNGNNTLLTSNSSNWNNVYTTVNANSSIAWNYQGTDLKNLSSSWVGGNIAYSNIISNSAAYLNSVNLDFLSVSSNWNNNYTTTNANSSNWSNAYSSVNNLSANWNSGAATVNVRSISALTYTVTLSDVGTYIRKGHTEPHTIIIPTFSQIPFNIGNVLLIRNISTNNLTITSAPSVTLNYFAELSANIIEQNSTAQLICVDTNVWDIV